MEQSLEEQITHLLAQIDAGRSEEHVTGTTTAETRTAAGSSEHLRRPRRVVNVYIDLQEEAHPTGEDAQETNETRVDQPIIEGTLGPVDEMLKTAARSMPPIPSSLPRQPHQHRAQKHRPARLVPIVVLTLCLLLIGAGTTRSVLALLAPTATITIVPVSTTITTRTTLPVVTGAANPTIPHLNGRVLASVTMNQAQTAPTTGVAYQEARAGTGRITFYNAAPYTQTVSAGTLLTGADGVQVVTEEDAIIPAVSYPTLGQATVFAHATITGPRSNIHARDLYGPCCRLNVSAVNSAFGGGQDARTYQTVSQADMKAVTSSLKASLDTSTQAALQAQVHADETLITPLVCQEHTNADHQVGDEAQQVHVTMSETCTGVAYHTQAYHDLALQLVSQAATKQLGEGYAHVGDIQATINATTATGHGDSDLHITVAGTWAYQFTHAARAHIKALLAGTSKTQAITILLQVPGVESASVSIENATTLPTDTQHIQVDIVQMTL